MKPIFIGIAGGTGSGKSTFTNRIHEAFQDQVTVLYMDSYYKAHNELTLQERTHLNYDHPDAYDMDLLMHDLTALKNGRSIIAPTYDFTIHNRTSQTDHVEPRRVILIEGILTLYYQQLRDMLDIKIFVDADADERILRRVIRDTQERGRSIENIVDQYLTTVKPMHYLYVEPTRGYADIVVNSGMNTVAFELMRTRIKELLEEPAAR